MAWFVCDIWHKYHSWYFKIVSNFTLKITYNNFEISLVVFMPKYHYKSCYYLYKKNCDRKNYNCYRYANIKVEWEINKCLRRGIVAFNLFLIISTVLSYNSLQRVKINYSKTVVLLQKYLANIGTQLPHAWDNFRTLKNLVFSKHHQS